MSKFCWCAQCKQPNDEKQLVFIKQRLMQAHKYVSEFVYFHCRDLALLIILTQWFKHALPDTQFICQQYIETPYINMIIQYNWFQAFIIDFSFIKVYTFLFFSNSNLNCFYFQTSKGNLAFFFCCLILFL